MYISSVPVHAVGVPYCVPSPDRDSLRVLQYVEKQLAHFNPSRSNSRQCKLNKSTSRLCFYSMLMLSLDLTMSFQLFSLLSQHAHLLSSFLTTVVHFQLIIHETINDLSFFGSNCQITCFLSGFCFSTFTGSLLSLETFLFYNYFSQQSLLILSFSQPLVTLN